MSAALLLALALAAPGDAPQVRVGSKKFTESVLLGELAAQLVESSGALAVRHAELGGTRVLWEALLRGDLDLYPEYTGTLTREILADSPPVGEAGLRAALAARGLGLTRPLGFDDAYAVGVTAALADRLGLRRISDLALHPELRLAFSNEFMDRADGWSALRDRYHLPQRGVRGLDHDVAYRALAGGDIDATDLYATDAEIRRYGIRVLEDDRHAFPEYQAVLVYRADLAARAPGALAAVERLEGRITADQMIAMNARARLDGIPAPTVAADFLRGALGLPGEARVAGAATRILGRTAEHLLLVALALAFSVALAVPLGVWAARRPAAGRLILAAAGVVQTIPSLALLVCLLPLLGIGARPAIVALVVYGLLPIVRNTHAGLTGLSPWARLRLVELPLASPAILAGVKTSAVITVGTATLGALIGAGGYGQPILAGIRLASTPLILEGAIPAALLALAVQALFDLAGRVLVPRGLRLRAPRGLAGR